MYPLLLESPAAALTCLGTTPVQAATAPAASRHTSYLAVAWISLSYYRKLTDWITSLSKKANFKISISKLNHLIKLSEVQILFLHRLIQIKSFMKLAIKLHKLLDMPGVVPKRKLFLENAKSTPAAYNSVLMFSMKVFVILQSQNKCEIDSGTV